MNDIKVFKVGGSVLAEPNDFLIIAQRVLQFKETYKCVVTSASKGKTDELIKLYADTIPKFDFYNFEHFVGMGEIQAAILFESVFRYLKVAARAILPGTKEWPIHISLKSRAQLSPEKINEKRDFVLLQKCEARAKKYLLPLLRKDVILVIPGFVAQDSLGRTITLGRGGSDISALIIAELFNAGELVLIKDVGGILSLDPKIISHGRCIKSLAWEELGILASSGSQVLNPISLKHRKNLPRLRIVSNNSESLKDTETEITFKKNITIKSSDKIFGVLTFIGEKLPETPGILSEISEVLAHNKIAIYSLTISDNLIAVYIAEEKAEIAYRFVSPLILKIKNLKALNMKKGITKVVIRSLKFINEPGIIKKIVTPIAKQGINIWEILTAHTDIMIFVEKEFLKKTCQVIKTIFKKSMK